MKKPEKYYIVFLIKKPDEDDLKTFKEAKDKNVVPPEGLAYIRKAHVCLHNIEDEGFCQWVCSSMQMKNPSEKWFYSVQGTNLHPHEAGACSVCLSIATRKIGEHLSMAHGKSIEANKIDIDEHGNTYVKLHRTDKPFSPKITEDDQFFTN